MARVGFSLEQHSLADGESFRGCSTLVKPLTFNSHLSFNVFHMCVPVALQGPGLIRSVSVFKRPQQWLVGEPNGRFKTFGMHHARGVFVFYSDRGGTPLSALV